MTIIVRTRIGEALIGLAIGSAGLLLANGARAMPMGTLAMPGPGFLPAALGGILALLGFLTAVRALAGSSAKPETHVELGRRAIAIAIMSLVWVGLTFETLGAELALAGLIFLSLRAFAGLRASVSVIAAIATSAVVCWAFRMALGVTLPSGVLGAF